MTADRPSRPATIRIPRRYEYPAVLVGARDAITAQLVGEAGFAGGWLSSVELSAVRGFQDRNLLTIPDVAAAITDITLNTGLPLVVDADNGYGSVELTARAVREFERAGAAGICIEDSVFPKSNSFSGSAPRAIVEDGVFAARLQAALGARNDPSFRIIARTEALTVGAGVAEGVERGVLAAGLGVDAVVVHSVERTGEQVHAIAATWPHAVPLMTIPTAVPHLTTAQLSAMGYSIVVYANQTLRAYLAILKDALAVLGSARPSPADAVPMSELLAVLERFGGDVTANGRAHRDGLTA